MEHSTGLRIAFTATVTATALASWLRADRRCVTRENVALRRSPFSSDTNVHLQNHCPLRKPLESRSLRCKNYCGISQRSVTCASATVGALRVKCMVLATPPIG